MMDARNLNGVLRNLVNGDVRRKDQFSTSVHSSQAATVRELSQGLAAVINGFHYLAGRGWIVFLDAQKYALQVVCGKCRPPNFHRQLPSRMEQPVKPLSNLLVCKVFTALQGRFTKLDGFNKAGFLGEKPADRLLRERIRVTASLRGKFRQLMLLLRREMYFHIRKSRTPNHACQRDKDLSCGDSRPRRLSSEARFPRYHLNPNCRESRNLQRLSAVACL
jgi:hypothetical protein